MWPKKRLQVSEKCYHYFISMLCWTWGNAIYVVIFYLLCCISFVMFQLLLLYFRLYVIKVVFETVCYAVGFHTSSLKHNFQVSCCFQSNCFLEQEQTDLFLPGLCWNFWSCTDVLKFFVIHENLEILYRCVYSHTQTLFNTVGIIILQLSAFLIPSRSCVFFSVCLFVFVFLFNGVTGQ